MSAPSDSDSRHISSQFCAENAEITFVSCDAVQFKIHRANIDATSEGFSPPSEATDFSEPVMLTETAATLELLFGFMYPRRPPDLTTLRFDVLNDLAEAAEKYQVFMAMALCKIAMNDALASHPLAVFAYATKHGYLDIADRAAPLTLDEDPEKLVNLIQGNIFIAWMLYVRRWQVALNDSMQFGVSGIHHHYVNGAGQSDFTTTCSAWTQAVTSVVRRSKSKPGALQNTWALLPSPTAECSALNLNVSLNTWRDKMMANAAAIPLFTSFLR